jgi:acetoacetyl-CoA synthetase
MASMSDILWQPSNERIQRTQMWQFMQELAGRFGFEPAWPAFHRWSCEQRGDFWPAMLERAGITPFSPARAGFSGEGLLGTRWFPGMTLNYAAHLLRRTDGGVAIRAVDERGRRRELTWAQLREQVRCCAAGLRSAGIRRGDRVAGFVPNVPEAVIAMLAAASLGAIWSSCSPDFGTRGLLDRFGQIAPRVLVACDGYTYNGKPIDCLPRVRELLEAAAAIERAVLIPFLNDHPDAAVPRSLSWDELCSAAGSSELRFEPVPFDHPLFIMYSSGTTGVPKCIIHGHGGTLLQHMKELMLHCDLRPDETILYFTTCGWMMWNWVTSGLGVGATLGMYEGSPSHPGLQRLWELAEQMPIHVLGISPKFLTSCEKAGLAPGRQFPLAALRCVLSTGSPLSEDSFRWVYRDVRSDLQLSSISGGTDIISCFMLGNPMLPVRAGEIQCLGLGMDVRSFDSAGREVRGQRGELVCCSPFPAQPAGFWNDPDGAAYRRAYFESFPGVWRHGDFVEITPSGGVIVYGRSDATLNPGGVRIGTAEIYRIVEGIEDITDSIVVGRRRGDDIEVCLFVVLAPGVNWSPQLEDRIRRGIARDATKRHVPAHIRPVKAVPYTISGKKVELAVAAMLHGEPVGNRDALANPAALDEYRNIL